MAQQKALGRLHTGTITLAGVLIALKARLLALSSSIPPARALLRHAAKLLGGR